MTAFIQITSNVHIHGQIYLQSLLLVRTCLYLVPSWLCVGLWFGSNLFKPISIYQPRSSVTATALQFPKPSATIYLLPEWKGQSCVTFLLPAMKSMGVSVYEHKAGRCYFSDKNHSRSSQYYS